MIKRLCRKIIRLFQKDPLNIDFPNCIRVRTSLETIQQVQQLLSNSIPGAYLRFGDGDVNLLEGKSELLQTANPLLQKEMKETFELSGDGIVKCLPLYSEKFGYEKGMAPGIHFAPDDWAANILSRCYKYFIGDRIYSHVALSYLLVFQRAAGVQFLKFLKSFNPIFVGNEDVPKRIVHSLFGETQHIKTPSKASFSQIDRIEKETLDAISALNRNYTVVVVAMGCSGRILQKRILQSGKPVFLFDFGSALDAICGWNTRAWIDLCGINESFWEDILKELS